MAEERIIDDEYGRGVRLRKTKDGYVDVTDELAENGQLDENAETESEAYDEVAFEFPVMDGEEDDEDLVGLSTEEALALRQQKLEAVERRKAEYEQTCQEGEELLAQGSFHAAELKFENALQLDELATVASVGYWRAKTADFTNPDVLIEEYLEAGIESLEYDLGYEATDIVKKDYRVAFEKRRDELTAEETPLAEIVAKKQAARREILSEQRKKKGIHFAIATLPFLVGFILTLVFAFKIPTTPDNRYVPITVIFGVVTLLAFFVATSFANKFLNACRIYGKNERLSSTEEGARLEEIRAYKELYECLLSQPIENEEAEETEEESPMEIE